MKERWKEIKGFNGDYLISNHGNVKSFKQSHNGRLLNPYKNHSGYLMVNLWNGVSKKEYRVHRLVATHFIPNPNNKPEVNHLDYDKTNNSASNLCWATSKENMKHSFRCGGRNHVGENHNQAKLSAKDVLEIREKYDLENKTYVELGSTYGVSKKTIGAIIRKENWAHL